MNQEMNSAQHLITELDTLKTTSGGRSTSLKTRKTNQVQRKTNTRRPTTTIEQIKVEKTDHKNKRTKVQQKNPQDNNIPSNTSKTDLEDTESGRLSETLSRIEIATDVTPAKTNNPNLVTIDNPYLETNCTEVQDHDLQDQLVAEPGSNPKPDNLVDQTLLLIQEITNAGKIDTTEEQFFDDMEVQSNATVEAD
ncbi:46312_t:CDS:2 [Gigaspora margarita]|uniref:46312_t:CDS:1 n=1 Tax=Gigaspora margarita TaxID=4874 RepID=A0ABN7V5E2_GIGMA|nr:46312_t:CDS:2 [Gigaspora margarita]